MQARYLGDVHDFLKFALLRHLAKDRQVGLAWYLTPPTDKVEGNQRGFLASPEFTALDQETAAQCASWSALKPHQRQIATAESWLASFGIRAFHADPVPANGDRARWRKGMLKALAPADVVFLDPDDGLETRSGLSPKHAALDDVAALHEAGKDVVLFQHKHRRGSFPHQVHDAMARIVPRVSTTPTAFRYHRARCSALILVPAEGSSLARDVGRFARRGWQEVSPEARRTVQRRLRGEDRVHPRWASWR
jgi:hypothetical protein